MVSSCCICKLTQGVVANISFHSIPKNETRRQKWCSAIGREITKRSFVCSKHFKESDFHYKVIGDTVQRFLLPGTIPSLLLTQHYDRESASIKKENNKILQTNVNTCEVNQNEENKITNDISTIFKENIANSEQIISLENSLNLDSDKYVQEAITPIESEKELLKNDRKFCTLKSIGPLTGSKRFCNPRFIGDLHREDFTSDAGYNIVKNYYQKSKKKLNTMNRQINRLTKKVENFQELLTHLKDIGLSKEALNALQVFY
ncbi:uncharacterized protein [Polyergus mexicanus]|uniref:uncharacterized protein isoform X2 n=1 Tax=Polyergus mexicanus TaxID=615972 RepID=UPI0038B4CE80